MLRCFLKIALNMEVSTDLLAVILPEQAFDIRYGIEGKHYLATLY
jgi:hypothetical protein